MGVAWRGGGLSFLLALPAAVLRGMPCRRLGFLKDDERVLGCVLVVFFQVS